MYVCMSLCECATYVCLICLPHLTVKRGILNLGSVHPTLSVAPEEALHLHAHMSLTCLWRARPWCKMAPKDTRRLCTC